MSTYVMSPAALEMSKSFNPRQVVMFTMSSRAKGAVVVEAHISKQLAEIAAKRVGGCVRVGRIVNGCAETM